MKSEFITDIEQQYEVYCKIAEEYGFIDLNAKKSGFRCTTKLNEFNAGWIAFTGAIAAMREDQQSKIDELQKRLDAVKGLAQTLWEKSEEKHQQGKVWESKTLGECADEILDVLEQALKGGSTPNLNTDENGECRHFSTTMFADGKAECFQCDAVVNEQREVIGKQSKDLHPFFKREPK